MDRNRLNEEEELFEELDNQEGHGNHYGYCSECGDPLRVGEVYDGKCINCQFGIND